MNEEVPDLDLVSKIKSQTDVDSSIEALSKRHGGLFFNMVNRFSIDSMTSTAKNDLVRNQLWCVFEAARTFDPSRNTAFSSHFANVVKFMVLKSNHSIRQCREDAKDDSTLTFLCDLHGSEPPKISNDDISKIIQNAVVGIGDKRAGKIISMRYFSGSDKVPWKNIARELNLSIQGCINIHDKCLNALRAQLPSDMVEAMK